MLGETQATTLGPVGGGEINLLTDPSALDNTDSWTQWTLTSVTGGKSDPDAGTSAFEIVRSSLGVTGGLIQGSTILPSTIPAPFQITSGKTYRFSLWAKYVSGGTHANLNFGIIERDLNPFYSAHAVIGTAGVWEFHTQDWVSDRTVLAAFIIGASSTLAADSIWHFYNPSVVEL